MSLLDLITRDFPTVISIVGAGGKTATLLRLGAELKALSRKAILTSTTRLGVDQISDFPCLCQESEDLRFSAEELCSAAEFRAAQAGVIFLVSRITAHKVAGLQPGLIDQLAGRFDAVVVEADGARGRSLKVPKAYEPAWPRSTHTAVALVGIDCLGRPLNETIAHRMAEITELTGLRPGECIDSGIIARCVTERNGLFRGAPPAAARVTLLNKVTGESLEEAKSVARLIRSVQPDMRIILGNVRPDGCEIWPWET